MIQCFNPGFQQSLAVGDLFWYDSSGYLAWETFCGLLNTIFRWNGTLTGKQESDPGLTRQEVDWWGCSPLSAFTIPPTPMIKKETNGEREDVWRRPSAGSAGALETPLHKGGGIWHGSSKTMRSWTGPGITWEWATLLKNEDID